MRGNMIYQNISETEGGENKKMAGRGKYTRAAVVKVNESSLTII